MNKARGQAQLVIGGRSRTRHPDSDHPGAMQPALPALEETGARAYAAGTSVRLDSGVFGDSREPSARRRVPGSLGCWWCGEPAGHSWPGKADDAPHPDFAN